MKTSELVEYRMRGWHELEVLCEQLESRRRRLLKAHHLSRFASLYRAACADLALADAYQLPPGTVRYLHELIGRAHNQLYRSRKFDFDAWRDELLRKVPERLFHDAYLRVAFLLFWGAFLAAMFLASTWSPVPGFVGQVVGEEMLSRLDQDFSDPINSTGRATGFEIAAAGFYINHNMTIGLQCFAMGILFGVGGLFATLFNAILLGTMFGYMTTVPHAENFFHFVTAHGPFELTAIVLAAAAGMRMGFSLVDTRGLSRLAALRLATREAMPTMGASLVLFFLAALVEGFISPGPLPYEVKAAVCSLSVLLLLIYFVVLGYAESEKSMAS